MMKFDNNKVRVREVRFEPGVARPSYTRPTNQVVVFLDDCRFERIDAVTGERLLRERKSGDVLWHDKGELAPTLINAGDKPYRTLLIELLDA